MPQGNDFKDIDLKAMSTIGLTETQARVYLTLVNLETAKATNLWKKAGVARQDIYRILAELEKKGLVERIIKEPTEFKAITIREGISLLLNTKLIEYNEIEKMAKGILARFNANKNRKGLNAEYEFFLRKSPIVNLERDLEALERVQTLKIIDSWSSFRHAVAEIQEYPRVAKRGIEVRVLTDFPIEGEKIFNESVVKMIKNGFLKIRHLQTPPVCVIVILDKNEVKIITEEVNYSPNAPYLMSNNPCFVKLCQDYFERLWCEAEDYKA
jgi:sugar-specific transcriptional regulator TrmB